MAGVFNDDDLGQDPDLFLGNLPDILRRHIGIVFQQILPGQIPGDTQIHFPGGLHRLPVHLAVEDIFLICNVVGPAQDPAQHFFRVGIRAAAGHSTKVTQQARQIAKAKLETLLDPKVLAYILERELYL